MPTVLVIGQDWTFRTAVRAELLELGVEALVFASWLDAQQASRETVPDVVVFDATSAEEPAAGFLSLGFAAQLVLLVNGIVPRNAPPSAMVLKKTLRVGDIGTAVRHLMEGHPA